MRPREEIEHEFHYELDGKKENGVIPADVGSAIALYQIRELLLDIRDQLAGVVSKAEVLAAMNPVTREEILDLLTKGDGENGV